MKNSVLYTALLFAGLQTISVISHAEVVGSTVIGVTLSEVREIASGWSVKNSIINKPIYNELGDKIGSVNDLIIAPNKSLSYVIIGAGGFLGMGKYDVAIPITQINEVNGKMQISGATKETIKKMPQFEYVSYSANKDAFVAGAEKDIQQGRVKLAELNKKALSDQSEMKTKINAEVMELQQQIKIAETKLAELKNATEKKWREYEAGVNAAIVSIRKHS